MSDFESDRWYLAVTITRGLGAWLVHAYIDDDSEPVVQASANLEKGKSWAAKTIEQPSRAIHWDARGPKGPYFGYVLRARLK